MICTLVLEKKIFKDFLKNPTWRHKNEYDKMTGVVPFNFSLNVVPVLFYLHMKYEHDWLSGFGIADSHIIWYFFQYGCQIP